MSSWLGSVRAAYLAVRANSAVSFGLGQAQEEESRDVPDLVKGIGTVGDELSEEDLLVGVELLVEAACAKSQRWLHRATQTRSQRTNGVDDEVQKLGDLSLETEGLGVGGRHDGRERRGKKREGRGGLKEMGERSRGQQKVLHNRYIAPPGPFYVLQHALREDVAPRRLRKEGGRHLIELTTPPLHLQSPDTQLLQPRPCCRARTSLPPLSGVVIRGERRETGRRDSRRCLTKNLWVWWVRDRLAPSERSYFCCCVRASSAERIVFQPRSIKKRNHDKSGNKHDRPKLRL